MNTLSRHAANPHLGGGLCLHDGVDFLKTKMSDTPYRCIVTNPPFRLAEEFVAHAILKH